ncbi:MAG: methyltransferase [Candidatus Woesearchaeota archaeon]|nr:MAG: methyltransferase [Candidatus Woesearchaeota archaeon]
MMNKLEINKIYNMDCLEGMKLIDDESIDMVFADLPYGLTSNKWDARIDIDKFWKEVLRIIKDRTPIIFTGREPFSSILVTSNLKMFRHKWVWNKNNSAGFINAKKMPLQVVEDILVFGKKSPNYYPIMEERGKPKFKGGYTNSSNYRIDVTNYKIKNNIYYPKNILNISNAVQKGKIHPTQKPIELLEYLIETYTKEGDLVLDPVIGSGTTALACKNKNRKFIGFEINQNYFELAQKRINNGD